MGLNSRRDRETDRCTSRNEKSDGYDRQRPCKKCNCHSPKRRASSAGFVRFGNHAKSP
jgi:hypothetical protein